MSSPPTNPGQQEVESPGLGAGNGLGPAFELKFRLTEGEAALVEAWARANLTPDPHGRDGTYHITSLYCDTAHLDVYHRSRGFRSSKYRLRRYGAAPQVYLERKTKRGDRVRKKRVEVPQEDLSFFGNGGVPPPWPGAWFLERVRQKTLGPITSVAYWRTAFFGPSEQGPIRLTLDRDVIGVRASAWAVPPLDKGQPLLPGGVLLELKYHIHLPSLYRDLLTRLPPQPARISKYRLGVELCGVQAGMTSNGDAATWTPSGGNHFDGR
jgi:hypothetical protein